MKKTYTSPQLTVHGSVEQLTQITGAERTSDVLAFNGTTLLSDNDSQDIDLVFQES
ncbi:MAG: lasso peptide [Cyanobacteria bacterium P01_D01_bin.44]